ncbi:MAG: hypothetical protein GVY35_05595 [Bacteroidetes bacterium]|jgi:hypothetical protein|nr:hypothetical protein [Bacteroidota bacterium]
MRRQPQPNASQPNGNGTNGVDQDVALVFRGAFRSETRAAIQQAIIALEQAHVRSGERPPQWLLVKVRSTGPSSIAATRLADGRTFRAATVQQLVADLQAATDSHG